MAKQLTAFVGRPLRLLGRVGHCDEARAGTRPVADTIDHALDSLAGFFANEADALDAMRRLSTTFGLASSQLLLLRPGDGSWLRFALHGRQWAARQRHDAQLWFGDMGLLAAVAAVLAGSVAALLLSLDDAFLILTLALLCGAAAGAAWAWRANQQPHLERFATIVRRQLVAGHWGLLVHGVPWERQAGSVALVRACSVNWCAVSLPQRAL